MAEVQRGTQRDEDMVEVMGQDEEVLQTEAKGTVPKAPKTGVIQVSLDMQPGDVVEWSRSGADLRFADEPGQFLELADAHVRELRKTDREKYFVAHGAWRMEMNQRLAETEGIRVSGRLAAATARLDVEGKDPSMHYCWKRPDELRQAGYDGYEIAKGANLRSFSGKSGSVHRVGAMGEDELILMQKPKEQAERDLLEPAEKSRQRVKNFDKASKSDIGQYAYDPTTGARGGGNFTPTR